MGFASTYPSLRILAKMTSPPGPPNHPGWRRCSPV